MDRLNDSSVFESDRLRLEPLRRKDAGEIFKHFTDKVNVYMSPPVNPDLDTVYAFIDSAVKSEAAGTDLHFSIRLKETGEFLGLCGLHCLQTKVPEPGIWTKISAHGHGYGKEAVGMLLKLAAQDGYEEAIYPADRRNDPSRNIARFYGGRLVQEAERIMTDDGRLLEMEAYMIDLKPYRSMPDEEIPDKNRTDEYEG